MYMCTKTVQILDVRYALYGRNQVMRGTTEAK